MGFNGCEGGLWDPFDTSYSATSYYNGIKSIVRNHLPEIGLYREYEEAVKLAKMILWRYDNSIARAFADEHAIPAFRIDMSLLYEHYVLGALRKAYGPKILYQANVTTGKPDFLYVDEACPLILDTKYKPRYGAGTFDVDDIRQLAGYARDRKALKKIGIQEAEMQNSVIVPCVIIYPEARGADVKFDGSRSPVDQVRLEVAPIGELVGFYRVGFPLPQCGFEGG